MFATNFFGLKNRPTRKSVSQRRFWHAFQRTERHRGPRLGLEQLECRIVMAGSGIVTTDVSSGYESIWDLDIQADGKLVAAGSAYVNKTNGTDALLVRYNSDGTLDSSFGGDGIVTSYFPGRLSGTSDSFYGVAIQDDQEIVGVGRVPGVRQGNKPSRMAAARVRPNGSLDTSFDGDGWTATEFDGLSAAWGVEIQSDHKIVAAGRAYSTATSTHLFAVTRYNANGSLDTSFGGTGKVTTDFGLGLGVNAWSEGALAIQSDGKIVVAGGPAANFSSDYPYFLLARYNHDGSLDTTFDGDGKVFTHFPGASTAFAYRIALQPDGKIVAGGHQGLGTGAVGTVVRYNSDGSLDASFGTSGVVQRADLPGLTLRLQSDGKIVVGSPGFKTSRLNPDGSLDTSFAGTGTTPELYPGGAFTSLFIQPDDKIVLGGMRPCGCESSYDRIIVMRLNSDGTLDTTFGDPVMANMVERVIGDVNGDGIFNSSDLVAVFAAGEYEDGGSRNSTFSEGDWNCDREFDSGDLVAAFQAGTYVAIAEKGESVFPRRTAAVDLLLAAAKDWDEIDSTDDPLREFAV